MRKNGFRVKGNGAPRSDSDGLLRLRTHARYPLRTLCTLHNVHKREQHASYHPCVLFLPLCTLCSSTYIKNANNVQLCAIHHVCTRFARCCAFFMSSTHPQRTCNAITTIALSGMLSLLALRTNLRAYINAMHSLHVMLANNKQCCFLHHENFIFIHSFIHSFHSFIFIFEICALTMHEHVVVFNRISIFIIQWQFSCLRTKSPKIAKIAKIPQKRPFFGLEQGCSSSKRIALSLYFF